MKPHRIIRHSSRVSSEHGCAIEVLVGEPGPTRYSQAKDEIAAILRRLSPVERRAMLVELAREELSES